MMEKEKKSGDKLKGGKPPTNPFNAIQLNIERKNWQKFKEQLERFKPMMEMTEFIPVVFGTGGNYESTFKKWQMEEKDMYYTPDMSEFYPGFEFEVSGRDKWTKHNSIDMFYNSDYDHVVTSELQELLDAKFIRVKKLDRQDIEELGFEDRREEKHFYNKDGNLKIQVVNWCSGRGTAMYIVEYLDAANVNIIFKGFVKNKSELKKILKMVGYAI